MSIIKGDKTIRTVNGITPEEEQRIIDFLQGAVYCWCKTEKMNGFH